MNTEKSISISIEDLNRLGEYIYNSDDWCYGHPFTLSLSDEDKIYILENYPNSDAVCTLKYDDEFIRKHPDLIPWDWISLLDISEEFIREFKDKVDWPSIELRITELCDRNHYSENVVDYILSDDFVREFSDKFSQKFLDKYLD